MTDAADKSPLNAAAHAPGPREARIAEMIRVDHAGEYGAVQIYRGQRAVFDRLAHKSRMSELLKEMEDGEQHHLATFDKILLERGVRPTAFAPVWNAAGFALGAATALMGEKAAMACTEAVEDVIEKHYAEQAEELGDTEPALRATIEQFREDEIGHKDTAIENGAPDAFGHTLLSGVIKAGCHIAIRLSEKI
ncbi:MAG: demethoxyubiquinone hydroxylase family protein [Pseudomonadota bacterium]